MINILSRIGRIATDLGLLGVILTGIVWRVGSLETHIAESGDEWGNTIAPFRVLLEGGDPQTFFHPSLYYNVVALVYALWFQLLKVLDIAAPDASMTDLFVHDVRYFSFPARVVSCGAAILTIVGVYRLGSYLWDRRAGLIAAALLALLPLHLDYSKTVRVDALAVLCVVVALGAIVRIPETPTARQYTRGGILSGLATSANYNGALTIVWMMVAHATTVMKAAQSSMPAAPSSSKLAKGVLLSLATFALTSPFILFSFDTFARDFHFIAGMAVQEHVGWEGSDFLYYARQLTAANPALVALVSIACCATLLFGNASQRLLCSFPIAYFLIFSLISSKDSRFILPALPLFLVVAGGLSFTIRERLREAPWARHLASTLALGLAVASLYRMVQLAYEPPPHSPLERPDDAIFAWFEESSPQRSRIVVESGIVFLLDTLGEDGGLARELRKSIVRTRPKLDHEYIGAIYIGGNNYDPSMVAERRIDYAIVSRRTVQNIRRRCEDFPKVCEFHRLLREQGELVFETPDGIEAAFIFAVGREPPTDPASPS